MSGVQKYYRSTRSFEANFKESVAAVGSAPKQRTGKVYYEKPGKMRWEFDPPERETIIADGKMIYDYQPDLNQVIETPVAKAFSSSLPVAFLLGVGDLARDFVVSLAPPKASAQTSSLVLEPKEQGELRQNVLLTVDRATCAIDSIRFEDALGNTTEFTFEQVRTNIALSEDLFAFDVPAGVDVIVAP